MAFNKLLIEMIEHKNLQTNPNENLIYFRAQQKVPAKVFYPLLKHNQKQCGHKHGHMRN